MVNQQQRLGGIYLRLSRDDGGDSESNSIGNQREMLRQYAVDKGITIRDEYVDDGVSGLNFERDGFKRMISDIEDGKIGTVIVKDLSRLGRNNALVAYYTEIFFVEKQVRFICINDNIDSAAGDNEIMGFKSVINEFYARDISKKIKSVKVMQAQKGKRTGGFAPFGYMQNPTDNKHLIIDENVSPHVKQMFSMIANGATIGEVRRYLVENGIPTPRSYSSADKVKQLDWAKSTITRILENRSYLGHTLSQKYGTVSFKSKKRIIRPESEWIEVKNTHEAIVNEMTFNKVQSVMKIKHRVNKSNIDNVFKGLLRCATCGAKMGIRNGNKPTHYICNTNRNQHLTSQKKCTTHHIRFSALHQFILDEIKRLAKFAKSHEGDLMTFLQNVLDNHSESNTMRIKQELERLNSRMKELDLIVKNLLEQNALGVISNERFIPLVTGYDSEQKSLIARADKIRAALFNKNNNMENTVQFFELIHKYTGIEKLTMPILYELIEKIVVHEKSVDEQEIDIHFRFFNEHGFRELQGNTTL